MFCKEYINSKLTRTLFLYIVLTLFTFQGSVFLQEIKYIILFLLCQHFFIYLPCDLYILSHSKTFVNTFFTFFSKKLSKFLNLTTLDILTPQACKVKRFSAKIFLLILLTKKRNFIHYLLNLFTIKFKKGTFNGMYLLLCYFKSEYP